MVAVLRGDVTIHQNLKALIKNHGIQGNHIQWKIWDQSRTAGHLKMRETSTGWMVNSGGHGEQDF